MVYVEHIDKDNWKSMSKDSHMTVFLEEREPDMDRIDYALLAVTEEQKIILYLTCTEFDKNTVYWNHGGATPPFKKTVKVIQAYDAFLHKMKDMGYKNVIMHVRNDNKSMLKLAARSGFKIVGIRVNEKCILLEHRVTIEEWLGNDRGHG